MSNPDLPTIAGFWMGPHLSWLDQVSLRSFVKHGHRFMLYTYGEVENVPDGIEVRPAQEIIEHRKPIAYNHKKSIIRSPFGIFSDLFRWHLMRKTDYIYTDLDRICLKPFDRFSRQELAQTGFSNGFNFARLPQNSPTAALACRFLDQDHPIPGWFPLKKRLWLRCRRLAGLGVPITHMPWNSAGSHLLSWALKTTGENVVIYPEGVFRVNRNTNLDKIPLLFEPPAQLEAHIQPCRYIVGLNWPTIYECFDGKFREFLHCPPKESWLGQQAAALGVIPSDMPSVVESREKNRQYLASITGDKSILL